MKKIIFYWSPHLNPVGTLKSTLNSALSLKKPVVPSYAIVTILKTINKKKAPAANPMAASISLPVALLFFGGSLDTLLLYLINTIPMDIKIIVTITRPIIY